MVKRVHPLTIICAALLLLSPAAFAGHVTLEKGVCASNLVDANVATAAHFVWQVTGKTISVSHALGATPFSFVSREPYQDWDGKCPAIFDDFEAALEGVGLTIVKR